MGSGISALEFSCIVKGLNGAQNKMGIGSSRLGITVFKIRATQKRHLGIRETLLPKKVAMPGLRMRTQGSPMGNSLNLKPCTCRHLSMCCEHVCLSAHSKLVETKPQASVYILCRAFTHSFLGLLTKVTVHDSRVT